MTYLAIPARRLLGALLGGSLVLAALTACQSDGTATADPGELAKQLAPPELINEPAYPRLLAGGVVGLATSQYLDQQQRATILRVLATVPGITYRGATSDLAGRSGLLFCVVAAGSTSTLVIDPATGELLAAQERLDGGRRPGLFSHILLLERGRAGTDTTAAPLRSTR
ncbi:hypothetical protein [Micromonospora sp. WMMD737]|uniref:hypothetical protein n=1 Tax=Micromonospora sp. WMMD737 TaxID=3404113 RepID=UPI003B9633D9